MNETIVCPGCNAELVLPILPPGQTVQCPRCQHVFEPAERRVQPTAPAFVSRRRASDEFPELDEPASPPRYRPLVGQWKAMAAVIALGLCMLGYGFRFYLIFETHRVNELNKRLFLRNAVDMEEIGRAHRQQVFVDRFTPASFFAHHCTFWPAMILFLIWMLQASTTLRILQATGMAYSPMKATFSFFIPFANFVLPYLAMQEIWRASSPAAVKDTRSWQQVPGGWLVLGWWLAFLAATMLRPCAMAAPPVDDFGFADESFALSGGSNICMIVAGVSLIAVIHYISKRQRARHAKIYDEAA